MTEKFITASNGKLSYVEVNSDKPHTLFLIAGNSGTHRSWLPQLQSVELKDYRIIALNMPGHGRSAPPVDTDARYAPQTTAREIYHAIEQLKNDTTYSLAGFSYGCNLIGELLLYDIDPAAICLISPTILGGTVSLGEMLIEPQNSIFFKEGLSEEDVKTFIHGQVHSNDKAFAKMIIEDYLDTATGFRSSLFNHAINQNYSDEISLFKKTQLPLLIIFGTRDGIVESNYLDNQEINLWKGRIFKIEDAGHFVHLEKPTEVNRELKSYFDSFR